MSTRLEYALADYAPFEEAPFEQASFEQAPGDPEWQLSARARRWLWLDDRRLPVVASPYTQGALALTYPLPSGLDCEPRSSALAVVTSCPETDGAIPNPERWAARFLQAVVEVVSSDRPLSQLARWTDPAVYADIAMRQKRVCAQRGPSTGRAIRHHVATVHLCQVTPEVAEVAARVTFGARSRALAARLDYQRERWTCTALTFG